MKKLTLALLALTLPLPALANPDCPELNGIFRQENAVDVELPLEISLSTERSSDKKIQFTKSALILP
jgi:hypothetical protein